MKKNYSKKSGVTLVELIIVVVILGVIGTLAITKFTQGNYSQQARIARLHDYAKKMSASARYAKNNDSVNLLSVWRHSSTGQWGYSAGMRQYMASISDEVDLFVGYYTGTFVSTGLYGDANGDGVASGGNTDGNWDYADTDEYMILYDEEIQDLNLNSASVENYLLVDLFGETSYLSQATIDSDFVLTDL